MSRVSDGVICFNTRLLCLTMSPSSCLTDDVQGRYVLTLLQWRAKAHTQPADNAQLLVSPSSAYVQYVLTTAVEGKAKPACCHVLAAARTQRCKDQPLRCPRSGGYVLTTAVRVLLMESYVLIRELFVLSLVSSKLRARPTMYRVGYVLTLPAVAGSGPHSASLTMPSMLVMSYRQPVMSSAYVQYVLTTAVEGKAKPACCHVLAAARTQPLRADHCSGGYVLTTAVEGVLADGSHKRMFYAYCELFVL
uniref:Fertility relative protein RF1 n=1 Tax=Triticum aestivum TaxID=4565 RepID=Q2IB37_WHEAT|nr:fertility relative protein RF1 [Triticum aestivum]